PCMADIGILASLDPIAIDQACVDLVYASNDPGKDHLIERIESRNGVLTIEAAAKLGYGSRDYELVNIDE
ncbi:MAG: ferredoxin, partial [Clostridia bacterium]|nr:ferredoxin [Clostridia bacterium]